MCIRDRVNGDNDTRPVNNNLIPGIGLPWEFSGYEAIEDKNGELSDTDGKKYNKGNEISFIYCVDRKKDMADNIIYTKGASIKSQVSLDSQNIVKSYPGLIYIILNDNIVENNNLTVPSGQTTETMNYYLAQVAIWYYIDVVNGTDYNFRADEKQTINDSTYGTITVSYTHLGADGLEEGAKAEKLSIAKKFLKDGIPIEVVSRNTSLSEEEIKKIVD